MKLDPRTFTFERWFLYTNYDRRGRVYFRDILPAKRPFGSNENEVEITDDLGGWLHELRDEAVETAPLLGGTRYYLAPKN